MQRKNSLFPWLRLRDEANGKEGLPRVRCVELTKIPGSGAILSNSDAIKFSDKILNVMQAT